MVVATDTIAQAITCKRGAKALRNRKIFRTRSVKVAIGRIKQELRSILSTHPSIFLILAKYSKRTRDLVVNDRTELVIEGFPRSGNTFTVVAFQFAQDHRITIAHHLHASAQIKAAMARRIPAIVLIREPADAVLSWLIRDPHLTVAHMLRHYIRFYTSLLACRDEYILATFEDVTGNLGLVMGKLNQRFGTTYAPFSHTADNVRKCFALVEQLDMEDRSTESVSERHVARPSQERSGQKSTLKSQFERPRTQTLLRRAEALYNRFTMQGLP